MPRCPAPKAAWPSAQRHCCAETACPLTENWPQLGPKTMFVMPRVLLVTASEPAVGRQQLALRVTPLPITDACALRTVSWADMVPLTV